MYQPQHGLFALTENEALHAFVRAHPLAMLVTLQTGVLTADPVPLLLQVDDQGQAWLRGHVARQNPLWGPAPQGHAAGVDVLAVFSGGDGYVSPSMYPTKATDPRVVPTWNYRTVHASGPLRAVQDADWIARLLDALTQTHEAHQPHPWQVSDAPSDYIEKMRTAVVGIEIRVDRWQGKVKWSQNQAAVNQAAVAQALGHP